MVLALAGSPRSELRMLRVLPNGRVPTFVQTPDVKGINPSASQETPPLDGFWLSLAISAYLNLHDLWLARNLPISYGT